MTIIHQPSTLVDVIYKQKAEGLSIGFVPTMGALHNGHIELVNVAGSQTDAAVCSIFINPTQFNDSADFKKYPRHIEKDILMLAKSKAHKLFLPSPETMYPAGTSSLEHYDLGHLETMLEGLYRPGHFQGVCQVMKRLLDVVKPDFLFMGQKDYQQCMVVNRLLSALPYKVTLVTCPTIREPDGLAMSSRNLRLGQAERAAAPKIFEMLSYLRENLTAGSIAPIKQLALKKLSDAGFRVDYIEVADKHSLQIVNEWDGQQELVALVAAFLGEVRLIDNIILN